jgi:hypothetical protein
VGVKLLREIAVCDRVEPLIRPMEKRLGGAESHDRARHVLAANRIRSRLGFGSPAKLGADVGDLLIGEGQHC